MTGNRILVGKFGDEVCKKGSLDVAIVSSPHPTGAGWTLPLGHSSVIMSSTGSAPAPGGWRLFGSSGAGPWGTGLVSGRHRQAGKEAASLQGALHR